MCNSFWLALRSLRGYRMRTLLTVAGLAVGIAAVVAVLSLGQGGRARITAELNRLGADRVWIASKAGLTAEDARLIRAAAAGGAVCATRMQRDAVSGGTEKIADIVGCEPSYRDIVDLELLSGRFLGAQDRRVAVLDRRLAKALFGSERCVGRTVRVRAKRLTVVGVVDAPGMPYSSDEAISGLLYLPLDAFEAAYGGARYDQVQLTAPAGAKAAGARIVAALKRAHGGEGDFTARTLESEQKTADTILNLFVTVLLSVAAICMLAGGIGVMNILLVSVRERRREIGVMMALGARRADVMAQFLCESMIFSALGGAAGIAAAVGLSWAGARLAGFPLVMPAEAVGIGIGFSLAVGWVFGMIPALRAARMAPVEALRA